MSENIKLECTSNASVGGEFIPAGDVREWPKDKALLLLSSNRFKRSEGVKSEPPKKKAVTKTSAD
jgi:hypothetical protein